MTSTNACTLAIGSRQPQPPTPRITAYVRTLLDRYPEDDEDARDDGPWSSKLAAYADLAPVTRQSGTSLAGETRSRRGSHRLKNAMFLAASASSRDPASRAFYDRKRAEGKRHNAALICLARRRDVILAILRTGQPCHGARNAPHGGLADAA